ncbi:MAG: hypothetical protein AAGA65_02355 [Actinomycetota bacterium]
MDHGGGSRIEMMGVVDDHQNLAPLGPTGEFPQHQPGHVAFGVEVDEAEQGSQGDGGGSVDPGDLHHINPGRSTGGTGLLHES